MSYLTNIASTILLSFVIATPSIAQQKVPVNSILFTHANIFDGVNEALAKDMSVLVEGNKITKIAATIEAPTGSTVIDAKGKVLMPGLIDVHWHTYYANTTPSVLMTGDMSEVAIAGLLGAEKTLMRGFTTVRDIGGNSFAVKKFADAGTVPGPRMFVSGPPLSQTGGHFDFGAYSDAPSSPGDSLPYWERVGLLAIADGVPEVTKRSREILRMGATQIKIAGGGGVSSIYDPLDVQEFTFEEIKAIVEVAETWNTYVAAHIFTDKSIQNAIKAGVKSIEHGNLIMDKKTLQMMKDNDVWLSAQPLLNDEDALVFNNPISTQKWLDVTDGTSRNYALAKKMGVKIAFGTDMLFDPIAAGKQGKMVTKLKKWFTPYEALKMVTSTNAELLMLSGPRNPYQEGPLGVIKEGAYADLILVNGNPLQDLDLIGDAENNFSIIMKDGKIYKNMQ
ncbi:hydrolase [Psychromonas marina]|uniref:Hydrolase n=1 Tax=Psychromonas marina TaxID=88364 RepID=A0ABQ6DXY6_9GAMM|nr:amidohydrolase family protein [Psychromonas marina]GLS90026.1 hydrolase [Psychromonas marina]